MPATSLPISILLNHQRSIAVSVPPFVPSPLSRYHAPKLSFSLSFSLSLSVSLALCLPCCFAPLPPPYVPRFTYACLFPYDAYLTYLLPRSLAAAPSLSRTASLQISSLHTSPAVIFFPFPYSLPSGFLLSLTHLHSRFLISSIFLLLPLPSRTSSIPL